ncbi:MAG: hypothetical protein LCH67_01485 [Bacteroidetes bacterium]|nr:hypothetical protein [Bacteroidota bacterium]
MVTTLEFKATIKTKLRVAQAMHLPFLEINARELHSYLGAYPGNSHSIPSCCNALRFFFDENEDEIISQPPRGNGPSLTIRYNFPKVLENYPF